MTRKDVVYKFGYIRMVLEEIVYLLFYFLFTSQATTFWSLE